jgi:hypothetical protein
MQIYKRPSNPQKIYTFLLKTFYHIAAS